MTWSEQQSTAVLRCSPLSATRLVPEMEAIGLLDADAAATLVAGMQPDHPTPVANDLFKLRIREVLSGECRAVQQSKL